MGKSKQIVKVSAIIRHEGERFTACVPLLPGAVSFGDTLEEAKQSIREAAEGVIEAYLDDGGEVPWRSKPLPEDKPRSGDIEYEFTLDA